MSLLRPLLLLAVLAAPLQAQGAPGSLAFVIERHSERIQVEADGTSQQETAVRVRIESPLGVRVFGQLRLVYNAANETLAISLVRVHKADGTVVDADLHSAQDLTGEVARDAPMYSDAREKAIPVPSLAPHDTLEFAYVRRVTAPLAKNQFWFKVDLLGGGPVLDELLTLDAPRDMALKLRADLVFTAESAESGRRLIRRWSFHQPDDSVLLARERDPGATASIQGTSFPNWAAVAAWYGGLERDRIVPDDAIRRKVAELTRGRSTPREKLEAIYDFVSTEIRYVGLSFGLGRFQPHAAAEVLANRYGDCKDKHTLLAALLGAAGISAHAALIRLDGGVDRDMPSPSQFDHVITAVDLGDSLLWLDVTPEVAPFGLLQPALRAEPALVVRATGSGLLNTPTRSPVPERTDLTITGGLAGDGLDVVVHQELRGDAELYLRRLTRITPTNAWQAAGATMLRTYRFDKGVEVRNVKLADPLKTHEPFFFEFGVHQANFVPQGTTTRTFTLPLPKVAVPDESAGAEVGGRPSGWQDGAEQSMRIALALPAGTTVRTPIAINLVRDWAEYHSTYRVEHDTLFVSRRFRTVERTAPSLAAPEYAAFVRAIRGDEAQTVELKLATVAQGDTTSADVAQLANAGYDALEAGDLRRAVTLLGRATRLDPQHKYAWNNLGLAYLRLQLLDSAETSFRRQVEVNPYDEYAWNNLGRVFWQREQPDSAAAAFRRQVEVNPLDKWAHANLGGLFLGQKRYGDAVPELEQAATITPEDPGVQVQLGEAYLGADRHDAAIERFKKAVEIAPTPTVWNNVSYTLAEHGAELALARHYAEAAVDATIAALRTVDITRLTPQEYFRTSALGAYWDTLGWVCFRQGDFAAARRFLAAAWQIAPRPVIGDHFGQALEKAGDADGAVRTYARVLSEPRAPKETRSRLIRLAGSEASAQRAIGQAPAEITAAREIRADAPSPAEGQADFMLLVNASGKVEASRYWRGNRKLEGYAPGLLKAKVPFTLPGGAALQVPVLATVSCPAHGACTVFLAPPETFTAEQR